MVLGSAPVEAKSQRDRKATYGISSKIAIVIIAPRKSATRSARGVRACEARSSDMAMIFSSNHGYNNHGCLQPMHSA